MQYFIKAFTAIAFVAVLIVLPAAPTRADAQADFKAARAAVGAGNLDEAIRLYTKVIQSKSISGRNLALTYFSRARVYDRKRDADRAIADYTRAIRIRPNYADAYTNRGIWYRRKGLHDKAIADYTRALKIKPKDADIYNNRGVAYKNMRQYGKAIADYTRAIDLNPKYASSYYNRGRVYELTGRKNMATQDYRAALRIKFHPDFAAGLKRLGATP